MLRADELTEERWEAESAVCEELEVLAPDECCALFDVVFFFEDVFFVEVRDEERDEPVDERDEALVPPLERDDPPFLERL